MARYKSINDIVNQVAVETGIPKTADIFASNDPSFEQLVYLANAAGYELLQLAPWQTFMREYAFVTQDTDTGKYELPTDFAYMIDQTGWERKENVPVFGPLSAQEWTYLIGRDLVSYTIYASFRLAEGEFWLFPYAAGAQATPDGLDINFEYISRNWVNVNGTPDSYDDKCVNPGDIVLYEPYMFERLLKARFLEARGFDSNKANIQFAMSVESWKGKDKSAPILNAGRGGFSYPYLDTYNNTPDTNYGD